MSSQLATRVEDAEAARFREITRLLGTFSRDNAAIGYYACGCHAYLRFRV